MNNHAIILLLLNYTFALSDQHVDDKKVRRVAKREDRLPVEMLLGDRIQLATPAPALTSEDIAHMDAATLIKRLEKLKEEYAGFVARGEDAEKVRESFDRISATLQALTEGTSERPNIEKTLAMLSEEEDDEEISDTDGAYGDYYSDLYGGGEEFDEGPDASLLDLQAWAGLV